MNGPLPCGIPRPARVLALLMLRMRTILNERKAGALRLNAGIAPAPRAAGERRVPAHPGAD